MAAAATSPTLFQLTGIATAPGTKHVNRRKLRTCEICGAIYRPTYSDQRTCGRRCGAELQRRNGSRITGRLCSVCGQRSTSVKWNGATCDSCHPARRIWVRDCDQCGKAFLARRPNQKRCGKDCAYEFLKKRTAETIMAKYWTDPAYRQAHLDAGRARAGRVLAYLRKRDHGRCGLCHKPVRAKTGPMRPSIDHIQPRSKGGSDDLANLQFAHYRCNLRKNNRGYGEQPLLIG